MDGALIDMTFPFFIKNVQGGEYLDFRPILACSSYFPCAGWCSKARITSFAETLRLLSSNEDCLNLKRKLGEELEEPLTMIIGGSIIYDLC